jgi:integrase
MSSAETRSARAVRPVAREKRRLRKTKTPGVYRRVDRDGTTVGYVAVIVVAGRQRKRMAPTYDAARRLKREGETARDRGVLEEHGTIRFVGFLDEWVERYQGQGRRGFRVHTRNEYRRLIQAYAHPYFPKRLKLVEITPYVLARFVDWLTDEGEQGKHLSDKTIANIVIPLRTVLKSAQREGLIRQNPSQGLALPHREEDPDEEEVEAIKIFSREQLTTVLSLAPERHKLLIELLAGCGLRISEAIALQRLHFQLDDGTPKVCIRRALVKGHMGPPKSKRRRRDIRLSRPLAARWARAHLAANPGESTGLVFTSNGGGPLDPGNLRKRVLKPLVEEVGAPWAGFHTFRHTFASIHLSEGTNLVALSRALGHHSPAFTLSRYTHLLPGDSAPPLDFARSGGIEPSIRRASNDWSPNESFSIASRKEREGSRIPAGPIGSFSGCGLRWTADLDDDKNGRL